jgi:hypothetical protein
VDAALPSADLAPPLGPCAQHQYLQQANEINALYNTDPHVWQTDGSQGTRTARLRHGSRLLP